MSEPSMPRTFTQKFSSAALELLITFLPFYLVALLYWLFSTPLKIWDQPDPALISSILFTEGWWKARSAKGMKEEEQNSLELLGVLGGITCAVIASLFVLIQLDVIKSPLPVQANFHVGVANSILFLLAVIYAFCVRLMAPSK